MLSDSVVDAYVAGGVAAITELEEREPFTPEPHRLDVIEWERD